MIVAGRSPGDLCSDKIRVGRNPAGENDGAVAERKRLRESDTVTDLEQWVEISGISDRKTLPKAAPWIGKKMQYEPELF